MEFSRHEVSAPRPVDADRAQPARGPQARPALLRLTLAELVEAVGAFTSDTGEQAVVVDHILRTRSRRMRHVP